MTNFIIRASTNEAFFGLYHRFVWQLNKKKNGDEKDIITFINFD